MDSTGALELADVPERLLVIGGGIIGLEMATVYDALGSQVTVVELTDQLMPGADRDLVKPLAKRIGERYEAIQLETKVDAVEASDDGLRVDVRGRRRADDVFDRVLVAVGRGPNGAAIGARRRGRRGRRARLHRRSTRRCARTCRTSSRSATSSASRCSRTRRRTRARSRPRSIAGENVGVRAARAIPSVAYTDPEVAWVGLTETRGQGAGHRVREVASFPWAASGRALALGRTDGLTKLIVDPETGRVLGVGIVGPDAGELIAEVVLAIEMGADAADIGAHDPPAPDARRRRSTLAAEIAEGTITDLPNKAAMRAAKAKS